MKENKEVLYIGDEVIVKYNDTYDLIRYKKYNGHKAVIVLYMPEYRPFEYKLRFINEEVQSEYLEDDGGIFFRREWLEKVGTNEEISRKYLEETNNKDSSDTTIEKPPVVNVALLDFSKACMYLENNGRKGIRSRLLAFFGDKVGDGAIIEQKLIYTEEDLGKNLNIPKDILLDLEKVKEVWSISDEYVYFKISM